jgi:hypothetical protein
VAGIFADIFIIIPDFIPHLVTATPEVIDAQDPFTGAIHNHKGQFEQTHGGTSY